MPIRKRLTLWYAGLMALITALITIAATGTMYWTLVGAVDESLEQTINNVIGDAIFVPRAGFGGMSGYDVVLTRSDFFRLAGVGVQVWIEQDNELTLGASNLGNYTTALDLESVNSRDVAQRNVTINDTPTRVLTHPLTNNDSEWFGSVQTVASLQTVVQTTDRLRIIMIGGGALAVLVAMGLGMWMSNRALKPVRDITRAATGIAETDDLKTRLPWDGPSDELGQLVQVFNRMMTRLEYLFSAQQRFVADVSHELRTPLTAVQGNVDIIKRYGLDSASLEAIDSETQRMSRMVEDLLLLARADYGGQKLDLYPLDLDTVVLEVMQQAQVLTKDRALSVSLGEFEPVRINGNSDRIKQLLFNLMSNSIKFTPDGGRITLSLQQSKNKAWMRVADTGIGIPPDSLEHIFDRFYQAEPSRAHDDNEVRSGAGLGLSIARWIVDAHCGTINVQSTLGRGTVVEVALPIYGQDDPETVYQPKPSTRSRLPRISRSWIKLPGMETDIVPEGDG